MPETFLGKAQRKGFDLEGRIYALKDPANMLSFFANYGGVGAKLLDTASVLYVPSVPTYVANVGVDFSVATHNAQQLSGTAYVTFVGKKYMTEDGQITTSPYSRVTGKLAYSWPDGWTTFGQVTWYPGDRLSEVAFNFGDLVTATSADIFVSPQPTLVVLAGVTYRFPTILASATPTLVTK